jgi:UDP-N-acetylmuramyl pentapeptide phosphotransferase/UDP-N-acetylglucosamine-1-phosphate transferase
MIVEFVIAMVLAGAMAYLLVRVLIAYARRRLLDIPNNRSSHTRPTPRGGGLAIVIVVLVGAMAWIATRFGMRAPLVAFWITGTGIAAVGWLDDVRSLRASTRLAAQAVATACFLAIAGGFEEVGLPVAGVWFLGHAGGLALAFVWIVGITNAFNFMDGIDGIAGSQGAVAGAAWIGAGGLLGEPLLAGLGALIVAANLGFLAHNWPPANIFMGDVGSTFLGFTLGAMPLLAQRQHPSLALFAGLAVAPFVIDACITFLRRLMRGVPVWQAHREHFYQRLVIQGWPHRRATLLYAALALHSAALGLGWLAMTRQPSP